MKLAALPGYEVFGLTDAEGRIFELFPPEGVVAGAPGRRLIDTPTPEWVHPNDRSWIDASWERLLSEPLNTQTVLLRFRDEKGDWRWTECHGTNLLGYEGVEAVFVQYRPAGGEADNYSRLKDSETFLRGVLDTIDFAVLTTAPDRTIEYANPAAEKILGVSRHEMVGRRVDEFEWEYFTPEGDPWPLAEHPAWRDPENPPELRDVVFGIRLQSEKPIRFIRFSGVAERGVLNRVVRWVFTFRDITDEWRSGVARRAGEVRLARATGSLPDGLFDWDAANSDLWWNAQLAKIFAYTSSVPPTQEVFQEIFGPGQIKQLNDVLYGDSPDSEVFSLDLPARRLDGADIWVRIRGKRQRDSAGQLLRVAGSVTDITELKEAEIAAAEADAKLAMALEAGGVTLFTVDTNSDGIMLRGPLLEKLFGPGANPCQKRSAWAARVHPEDVALARQAFARYLVDPSNLIDISHRMISACGEEIYVKFEGRVERDVSGAPIRMFGTGTDITAQRRQEARTQYYRDRLDQALGQGSMGIWVLNLNTGLVSTGGKFFEVVAGRELEQDIPLDEALSIATPESQERARRLINEAVRQGKTEAQYPVELIDPAGRRYEAMTFVYIDYKPDGSPYQCRGVTVDITAQCEEERRARLYQERLELALQQGSVGIWVSDLISNRLSVGGKLFEDLYGFPIEEEIDGELGFAITEPESRAAASAVVLQAIKDRRPTVQFDARFRGHDGREIIARSFGNIDYLPDGTAYRIRGATVDITAQVQAESEIRALNEQLERKVAERTRELREANRQLESFAYSVSHDLRGPLRAINGYATLLMEDYGDTLQGEALEFLEGIIAASQNMGDMIEDLLEFSRLGRQALQWETLAPHGLIESVLRKLQDVIEQKGVRIRVGPLPDIECDRRLLLLVFHNLIENAMKFARSDVDPVIEIGAEPGSGSPTFYVKDNGIGFEQNQADRIFRVFERLHPSSDVPGTGVGLAIVRRIVVMHGGTIWAEGAPNQGACFRFQLGHKPEDPPHDLTEQIALGQK